MNFELDIFSLIVTESNFCNTVIAQNDLELTGANETGICRFGNSAGLNEAVEERRWSKEVLNIT